MIHPEMKIFCDPDFMDERGIPKTGADIHLTYIRVHPIYLDQLRDGIKQTLGLELEVITRKEDGEVGEGSELGTTIQ